MNDIDFESRFESGNLRMAIKLTDNEYDLILRNDINANKYAQWFYFKIQIKFKEPKRIKFNIINCEKADSPYSKGSRILQYSTTTNKWSRKSILNKYYKNSYSTFDDKNLYTLSFSVNLGEENLNETVYFAYCYPYTYSYLQEYINKLVTQKNANKIMNHEVIATTLAGNNLDMILVTDFLGEFDDIAGRPCIILTSRVHPGESNSSFVIHGLIEFITGDSDSAKLLRKKYIFKIIPMLNPDGVINGCFRTNLRGKDLNRQWKEPSLQVSPTILSIKETVKKTLLSRNIYLYCDFHGHSNKKNFFLYGCNNNNNKKGKTTLQEIILAKLLGRKLDFFDYASSIFKIAPGKLKTGRAVIKKEYDIDFSYCLESSMEGISIGKNKNTFFTPALYKEIGYAFCNALYDMVNQEIFMSILYDLQLEEALKLVNNVSIINNIDLDDDEGNTKTEVDKIENYFISAYGNSGNGHNSGNTGSNKPQKHVQSQNQINHIHLVNQKDKLKLKPINKLKNNDKLNDKFESLITEKIDKSGAVNEKSEKVTKDKLSVSNKVLVGVSNNLSNNLVSPSLKNINQKGMLEPARHSSNNNLVNFKNRLPKVRIYLNLSIYLLL